MSEQRLNRKVAIVTGSSSGIGRSIALMFARHGAMVVCADLRPCANQAADGSQAVPTHEAIKHSGGSAFFKQCDVGDHEDIENAVACAVDTYGRLDIMVNNAGISLETPSARGPKNIEDTDIDTFDKTISVNLRSVFLGCKFAIRQFLAQEPLSPGHRGWIVNTASIYGLVGAAGYVSYSTSKGGIIQMTRSLAVEQASRKIHCNAICPGFVPTQMDAVMLSDEREWAALAA